MTYPCKKRQGFREEIRLMGLEPREPQGLEKLVKGKEGCYPEAQRNLDPVQALKLY